MGKTVLPVILAGGSGTRLWPLSRKNFPKQYFPLINKNSLLQNTVTRFKDYEDISSPLIICNEDHRFLIAEQLRKIHVEDASIMLEPLGRNTAPAIAVAALHAQAIGFDGALLILPADHYIEDLSLFHELIQKCTELCSLGKLITFGIEPNSPETGYGYIKKGNQIQDAYEIKEFHEKPDLKTATNYYNSGEYLWNSGMFMMTPDAYLDELSIHCPEMLKACKAAYGGGIKDMDFFRLDRESFAASPEDSIDYAVMQKTANGIMVPFSCKWSDVGSWDAIWSLKPKDENQNVVIGDVVSSDVKRSYLHSTSRLLAVVGLEDHVVVETSDAVLVAPKDNVQDVKLLVDKLKAKKRDEAITHKKVFRPWGSYETIDIEDRFQVKRIIVNPGAKLSLQKHFHRAEHWVVVHGTAIITCEDKEFILKEDESTYIPLGHLHRLENPGKIPLHLIEVQSGSYLGEDDIVRTEDVYGRNK